MEQYDLLNKKNTIERWHSIEAFIATCDAVNNVIKGKSDGTGIWSLVDINLLQDYLLEAGYSIQPVKKGKDWLREIGEIEKNARRGWEILSVSMPKVVQPKVVHVFDGSAFDTQLKNTISSGKTTAWSIHSVKRLTDGEVFTIGDFYYVPIDDSYRRINHFDINEGGAMFLNYEKKGTLGLNIMATRKMQKGK